MKIAENEKYLIVKMEDYRIHPDRVWIYEKNTKKIKLLKKENIEKNKEIKELCKKGEIKII